MFSSRSRIKKMAGLPPAPSPVLSLQSHGMVTVIGNSSAQTVAAWCAESRRWRRVHLDGFADPFTIADCHSITNGRRGVERLAALLASAVCEALDGAAHLDANDDGACLEILIVPAWLDDADCTQLQGQMATWVLPYKAWSKRSRSRLVVRAGAIGAWEALEHAYRALAADPRLRHVMLAAVDSACDPAILSHAAQADWLFRPGNGEGYVAGEGSACLLLQRVASICAVPAGGFALHRPALVEAAQRFWPGNVAPDAGALSQAMTTALQACAMDPTHISDLHSDMDGSAWRAHVEGSALNRVIFNVTAPLPHWKPATIFGQIGTPAGIIGWLLPTVLHQQGIERINTMLNWSLDPAGKAAACVLERSPN